MNYTNLVIYWLAISCYCASLTATIALFIGEKFKPRHVLKHYLFYIFLPVPVTFVCLCLFLISVSEIDSDKKAMEFTFVFKQFFKKLMGDWEK